ncbi:MAG: polysaccharide deacetylase family protein [Anaerolineae bacterium]
MTHNHRMILSFDMETDIGSWTYQVRGITEGTPEILRVLRNHHVPATFLFTGREAQNNPAAVESVLADGHEVGCHTMFHETIGQPVYDVPVGSFALESEIEGRLQLATETVEKVAGVRPISFRAPRLFGSTSMIKALEKLEYKIDSSFPAYFYGRDFLPYHPSRTDWSAEGDMAILEMPVFYDMDAGEKDDKNRGRDQWPMLRLKGARWFADLCARMFERVRDQSQAPVLCVYLHPWEFVPMPEKVHTDESTITFKPFLYRNTGRFALEALDEFIDLGKQKGWQFEALRDLAASRPV